MKLESTHKKLSEMEMNLSETVDQRDLIICRIEELSKLGGEGAAAELEGLKEIVKQLECEIAELKACLNELMCYKNCLQSEMMAMLGEMEVMKQQETMKQKQLAEDAEKMH